MIKVSIQDNIYPIPTSIDDITIERFIEFRNLDPNSPLDLIYWILGCYVKFEETNSIERELANILTLSQPCIDEMYSFMNSKNKYDTPSSIEIFKETIELKKGLLNELPYWPYVVTKSIIIKNLENPNFDPTDDIPTILAHYLYEYVTKNKYTEKNANEFVDVINDLPMKPAIQLGNFFLKKQQDLFPSSKNSLKVKLSRSILRPV